LVIHGLDDEIVNFQHGQSLYDAAFQPKYDMWIKTGGHYDVIESDAAAREVSRNTSTAQKNSYNDSTLSDRATPHRVAVAPKGHSWHHPPNEDFNTAFADKQKMDLVTAAVNMQQANLMGQVQILVARKILDSEQQQGAAADELIEAASNGVNQAGNALIAATGLGGQLDVTA
jgi:hypothetical protein